MLSHECSGLRRWWFGGKPEQHQRFSAALSLRQGASACASLRPNPAAAPTSGISTARRGVAHHRAAVGDSGSSRAGSNGYLRPPDGTDREPDLLTVVCRTDANVEPSRGNLDHRCASSRQRPDLSTHSTCWDTFPISRRAFRLDAVQFRPEILLGQEGADSNWLRRACG